VVGNFAFVTHAAAEQVSILFRNGFVVIVSELLFAMVHLTVFAERIPPS